MILTEREFFHAVLKEVKLLQNIYGQYGKVATSIKLEKNRLVYPCYWVKEEKVTVEEVETHLKSLVAKGLLMTQLETETRKTSGFKATGYRTNATMTWKKVKKETYSYQKRYYYLTDKAIAYIEQLRGGNKA